MTKPPHLTLIDGSGFIFRAYHRLPPLTDPEGTPVGAVFGFTSMLWNLIEAARKSPEDDYLAVILDAGKHSFRNDLYPEYKANRPEPPEDLRPQFPLIRDAVNALGVPCIEKPLYEADDLIASYAEAAIAAGMTVTIVSSDKDLMQLIRPGLTLLDTMQNKRFSDPEVLEKWGVPPAKLAEVLALMGDSVDNVPGVPGVGPKTAADLVNQYGDLEGVLAAIPEIKRPKLRENLELHAEAARLSRVLVELKRDLPLEPPLDALKLDDNQDRDKLAPFLAKHGFRTLLAKLGEQGRAAAATIAKPKDEEDEGAPDVPFDLDAYECVTSTERLNWWLDEARRLGKVAFDTETSSLDAVSADLVGFSLALQPGKACYVPLAHVSGEGLLAEPVDQLSATDALPLLKPLLEDAGVLKIGQNLKYDMLVLASHGISIAPFDDTMLLSYALSAGLHGHGMDELSEKLLGHTPISFKDVAGSGKAQLSFAQVPLDKATRYAAEDADVTFRLWQKLKPRLWREKVTRTYEWQDRPLVPVLARMEGHGVKVDRVELARMSTEFAGEMARLEGEVHAIAGQPFALGSPKQLGEILFDKLGLPGGKKGKTGQYSTDVTELERLAALDLPGTELARKLLDWRQVSKLRSTYTEALQQQINPQTGRVHTSFSMAVAATGRLASTDPNLQNIPIRTAMGRRIRDAFVAEPGNVILSADYNQIELRLMAHIADVPELKEAYASGQDIHALTARQVFGLAADAPVDRDLRGRAKTINFSIIYGISAFGLAQRLGISRGEAQEFIERYLDRYHGIRRYMAETVAKVREDAFVTTLYGRRINVPGIRSKVQSERGGAERAAINAPVQGTAADIIKRAMIRMEAALAEAGLTGTRMLLQVHDELVFEAPESEAETAKGVIRTVMESAAGPALALSVPLGVEVGTGANWGAAH
ncbi:DNA polymerase I [Sandaracinobacter neustonicus]|uniref:DNA polymerase I n=1 Tax=Sandaracinobacter neustonicus TaxID=1715348 RepID=A0A501XPQ2_9SPHN|nr:DNA polymerase I [Sandaracinobacter neustonicus]TPE62682.1 DNA polymerase I [Sandaracinobacter neustonicus]